MNLVQILASMVSAVVGVFIAGQVVAWRHRRAERDAAAGRAVSVPGSLRALQADNRGRLWRHGTLTIHGGRVVWTPRTPWGRALELGEVAFGRRSVPTGALRFQLPSAAVVMPCSSAQRGYELAVLPASVKYLLWAQAA